jgi:hypothetical protein
VNLWGLALTRQSLVGGQLFRPFHSNPYNPHPLEDDDSSFQLSPRDLHNCYCRVVSAVVYMLYIIDHCEEGARLPVCSHPRSPRSKVGELVDWESCTERLGAGCSWHTARVDSGIWSCLQAYAWFNVSVVSYYQRQNRKLMRCR